MIAGNNHSIDYNFLMKYFCRFLALLFLMPVALQASDLTLFGGFHHPGKITLQPSAGAIGSVAGQLLTDPKDFGVFGARLYRSNLPVGAEYTVAYSPSFIDSQANAFIYNVNLRASLLPGPVTPYVTAGLGGIRAGGDGPGAFGNKFAFNYGGGLKVGLIGPIEARFALRGYSVRGIQDQSLNLVEASVGIVFGF